MISSNIFTRYEEIVDSMINTDFGITAYLYMIGQTQPCQCSSSIYAGPPTLRTNCSYCNGSGVYQQEHVEEIKLRVYYDKKSWIKVNNINTADGIAQIIGFLADVNKIRSAQYIILNRELNQHYKLSGELTTWGLKHRKYFVGYLERC